MSTYLALRCERLSDDLSGLVLRELPRQMLGAGDVRVAVHAAGLNFPDLLMTRGTYQLKPPLPFVPGMEGAGTVLEAGAAAGHWRPGDRVYFQPRLGALAQEVVLPGTVLNRLPSTLDFDEAACFMVTGLTAWVALARIGQLRDGETLLVHGARGGVGMACVQLGQHFGARTIATASQPAAVAKSLPQGTHVIAANGHVRDAVLELTGGRGVDVVADPVGGELFDQSARCMAWGGRLLVLGFASGRIPTLAANLALIKGFAMMGVRAGEYGRRHPDRGRENIAAVERLASAGVLRPVIGARFAWTETMAAFTALAQRGVVGKVVITG